MNEIGDPYQFEQLTGAQRLNEKIMTGLRRMEGILADPLTGMVEGIHLSLPQQKSFFGRLQQFVTEGLCISMEKRIILSEKGKLYADYIASGLFQD
jgi:coproporphyrinogen III oxidase-like Fe-S oxidoreductase